jgi:hypothetical protein
MQRLFSMFPSGLPGLALLLLRLSVVIALLLELHARRHGLAAWTLGAVLLLAAMLCAGLLTPAVATLALAVHVAIWWWLGIRSPATAPTLCLDALALAMLGPGAYSVDAYWFGRRVVVLPPT